MLKEAEAVDVDWSGVPQLPRVWGAVRVRVRVRTGLGCHSCNGVRARVRWGAASAMGMG